MTYETHARTFYSTKTAGRIFCGGDYNLGDVRRRARAALLHDLAKEFKEQ